jgi:hypothetical protein
MAKSNSKNQNASQTEPHQRPQGESRPYLNAFHVKEFEVNGEPREDWTRIGVAWPHKDGKGFNLQLELVPVNGGRIVIREPEAKDEGR